MDHDATREQLELAAAEPGGIDRLIAGDTATAQAVAAHLAGCPECTDELPRLERVSRLVGTVVREAPPDDLRERTLAMVLALGRPRGDASAAPPDAAANRPGCLRSPPLRSSPEVAVDVPPPVGSLRSRPRSCCRL